MLRNEQIAFAFALLGGVYLCSFLISLNIVGLGCLVAAGYFDFKAGRERKQLRHPARQSTQQLIT